jgi:7-cyano-7-deazaguanine synthase
MKAIVSLSGGLDSTTLLADIINSKIFTEVSAVGFTYGAKHNSFENIAAKAIAFHYDVPFELIDISGVMKGFKSNLLKTGGEIPEGHYEDKSMSLTVVPGRNIIFLSILAGLAWSKGAERLFIGIHAGDHAIYPDCRPNFFVAMREAIYEGTDSKVEIFAPFLNIDKGGIVARGLELKVPYELTRTCYKAQSVACGKCGSCRERLAAFKFNGIKDPLIYEK